MPQVIPDTLAKLHAHGHGVTGYCLVYRRSFAVSLATLIAERGSDSPVSGTKPLTCPGPQGRRTT